MPRINDFVKDTTVIVRKGVKGISVLGEEIIFKRNVTCKVYGIEEGKVIVDALSAYHSLIRYSPSDLEIKPATESKRHYHRIKKLTQQDIRE